MSEGFVDPYIDPLTGVLRNLVGATTYDELNNAFVCLSITVKKGKTVDIWEST